MTRKGTEKRRRAAQPPALALIEESAHLLRRAPAGVFLFHLLGAGTWVLAVLFAWAYVSWFRPSRDELAAGAAGLCVLYAWLKVAQSEMCARLMAFRLGATPEKFTWRRAARLAAAQFGAHAWGPAALAVSAVLTAPFGYAWMYFQTVTVLGAERGAIRGGGDADAPMDAWALAKLWPGQTHVGLLVISALALAVFANVAGAFYLLPWLARTLLGIENFMSLSGWSPFNTTFLMCVSGLTWLAVDPLAKAFCVLRVFRGRALRTGEDLRIEMAAARKGRRTAPAAAVACVLLVCALSAAGTPLWGEAAERGGELVFCREERTPTGFRPPAQGCPSLRGLPWVMEKTQSTTPTGLWPAPGLERPQPRWGCESLSPLSQGRLLCSQPWAGGHNAVGVERALANMLNGYSGDAAFTRGGNSQNTQGGDDGRSAPAATALQSEIPPAELDRAIDEVLARRDFQWQLQPQKKARADGENKSAIERFFNWLGRGVKSVVSALRGFIEWLADLILSNQGDAGPVPVKKSSSGGAAAVVLKILLIALIVVLAGLLVWIIFVAWRGSRRQIVEATASLADEAKPDLRDDNVQAAQLPADGWLQLAREQAALGEWRLALRALYLAHLARLGAEGLLTLRRHKTNLDYERELRRRALQRAGLSEWFSDRRREFEAAWYGREQTGEARVRVWLDEVEKGAGP